MNRRKLLTFGTVALFVLGSVVIFSAFVNSLAPNAKGIARANDALTSIDLSTFKKGTYSFHSYPIKTKVGWSNDYNWVILIYKNTNGIVKTWDIPMKGKYVGMPDQRWYKPSYDCKNFGPTVVSGIVDESQPIRCHDKEYSYSAWTWDLNGKASSTNVDDLYKTKGSLKGSNFVFSKHKS